jgi:hypothetical protein
MKKRSIPRKKTHFLVIGLPPPGMIEPGKTRIALRAREWRG